MEWVHVEDRLPEEDGYYETKVKVGSIAPKIIECTTRFHRGRFSKGDWRRVTHWMYIPKHTHKEESCTTHSD